MMSDAAALMRSLGVAAVSIRRWMRRSRLARRSAWSEVKK